MNVQECSRCHALINGEAGALHDDWHRALDDFILALADAQGGEP